MIPLADRPGTEVVLFEPQIPPNTGAIARLCAGARTPLHLVKPLGFDVDDRATRRAGLDYWNAVELTVWNRLDDLLAARPGSARWWATKHGSVAYHQADYRPGDLLIFGSEPYGLPEELYASEPERTLAIPMDDTAVRCLNLANAVSIVLYESLRRIGRF